MENSKHGHFNIGYIYLIITAIMWSTGGFLVKIIDAHPVFIAFGRSLVVAIMFLPWVKFKQIKFCKELWLLCISYTTCLASYVIAVKLTTAANAIAIQYTAPLFLFFGKWVLKGIFDKKKILPMALIFIAIVVFLLEPSTGTNVYGNLIALISGISFAATTYYMGFDYNISPIGLTGFLNLFMAPVLAFFVPWSIENITTDTVSIIALIILGAVQIGIPYILFNIGRKTVDSLNASIICLIEPMLSPLLVFLIVSEIPTTYAFIGAAFMLLGQIFNTLIEMRSRREIRKTL